MPEFDSLILSDIDSRTPPASSAARAQQDAALASVLSRTWQLNPDLLGVANSAGYFEASNPAWATILGWSEAEIAGTPFHDLVHPDDRARTTVAWQDLLQHQLPAVRFENRYRHKAGGWRWLSWLAVPDGDKVYCSGRDITVEKEAEAALVARTAERDRMWNSSPDLMLVIDFDGVFQRVNPAWTHLLGYAPDELVGHHVNEFVIPEDHDETVDAYTEAASGGLPQVVNRYRHKDGSIRWISWVAAPADAMTYATGRDITAERARGRELERAQEQLRQSQKMEAVGQLTGGLAHDFNNLLAGVLNSLELVNVRLGQGRVQDVGRYIDIALGATKRAAALTHRLLAFSRRQTLAPKTTDVNQLVYGMLDMVRRTVGPGIEVDADCTDAPWAALVDPSQLENALLNLCINARDAMPDGGNIVIKTRNCHVDRHTAQAHGMHEGEFLLLKVADTGSGMTPGVAAKAFDPFFTTKPMGQGTGLGLSMIYGFAKQSGGHVFLESAPGQGTRVHLYLPRHHGVPHETTAPVAAPPAQAGGGGGETILLVEDEEVVRVLVNDILSEQGYRVIEAVDGAAGLAILQSRARIGLLVSDVGLPGVMNGRQMADAAQAGRPGLSVLFITGYAEKSLLSEGQLEPHMSVLTKPFSAQALTTRVRELLAQPVK